MNVQEYHRQKREELDLLFCDEVDGRLGIKPEYQHLGCPYCNTRDYLSYDNPGFSKGLNYVRCRTCRLVYPLPRLSQEALDARVDSPFLNDYIQRSLKEILAGEDTARTRGGHIRRELDLIGKSCPLNHPEKPRVLEVGCSDGRFLKAAAELGCRVTGLEPNTAAAEIGRSRGLEIIKGFFRPGLAMSAGDFDLIVFRESLYHLFDVKQALGFSRELLAEGGSIYIKCFNVDSFAIETSAVASGGINGLDIPSNFSPASLAYMLKDSGFEVRGTLHFPEHVIGGYLISWKVLQAPLFRYPKGLLNRGISQLLILLRKSRNFGIVARKVPG